MEFPERQEQSQGAFIPQQIRWAHEPAAESSAAWWPTLNGQPGVVGRAVDLIRAQALLIHLELSVDGIVIVESVAVALELWNEHQWRLLRATYLTLSGGHSMRRG